MNRLPQKTQVKVCLVRRAALPDRYPQAYEQLVKVLDKVVLNTKGCEKIQCRCREGTCATPAHCQVAALMERINKDNPRCMPAIAKLFGR